MSHQHISGDQSRLAATDLLLKLSVCDDSADGEIFSVSLLFFAGQIKFAFSVHHVVDDDDNKVVPMQVTSACGPCSGSFIRNSQGQCFIRDLSLSLLISHHLNSFNFNFL